MLFCLPLQRVRDYTRNKCQASADSTASTTWSSERATLQPNWRTLPTSSMLKRGSTCWQKGLTPPMRCGEPNPCSFCCSCNGLDKNAVKTTFLPKTAVIATVMLYCCWWSSPARVWHVGLRYGISGDLSMSWQYNGKVAWAMEK